MKRVFEFLRIDDLPLMTRPNYVAECRQMLFWGIVAGSVEGNMVGIVASKTFEASRLLTTVVWALPILMNVLNVGWGAILRGRPRKQAFFLMSGCALAFVASVSLTSDAWQPWGGWMFAAQIGLTHLFMSGLITLRTTIWKVNYPAAVRARITGRLQTLRIMLSAATSGLLALLYDDVPEAYRFVYPAVAVIGVISLVPMRRLRIRGERLEFREFSAHSAGQAVGGRSLARRIVHTAGEALGILREDTVFARYMLAQFLLGASNFFTDPILVNALTKELELRYSSAQGMLYLIPTIMLLVAVRWWGRYFDKVGVLRFRVTNSAFWVAAYVCVAVAMLMIERGGPAWVTPALLVLALGRMTKGVGHGGGVIAWFIGHLSFARPHQTEVYMGIHVGLTGLRALVMPLVGFAAYHWLGYSAMVIPVLLALTAHLLFRRLAATSASPVEATQAGRS